MSLVFKNNPAMDVIHDNAWMNRIHFEFHKTHITSTSSSPLTHNTAIRINTTNTLNHLDMILTVG